MKEAITGSLDMQNTFIQFTELNKTNLVNGRDAKGNMIGNDEAGIIGVGGIKSTAEDLVKYICACIKDTSYIHLAEEGTFDEDEHSTACLGWGYYNNNGLRFYVHLVIHRATHAGLYLRKPPEWVLFYYPTYLLHKGKT